MISHIQGRLKSKLPTYTIIEVNGLGYGVHIPLSTYESLEEVGSKVGLHTYLYVREDCLQLYGFKTLEEKELFQLLLSVSGVGPRVALAILSGLSVSEFREAVSNEDVELLTTISGIGKRTAQRLILELKDRIGVSLTKERVKLPKESRLTSDAITALISLGCKSGKAARAVREAKDGLSKDASLQELIKRALKHL